MQAEQSITVKIFIRYNRLFKHGRTYTGHGRWYVWSLYYCLAVFAEGGWCYTNTNLPIGFFKGLANTSEQ